MTPFGFVREQAIRRIEKRGLTTPRNGPETPAAAGLAYERVRIGSGGRVLDAWFVPEPSGNPAAPALLIFHGNNDSISRWVGSLRILAGTGITSMVFDYSGFGESSGRAGVENFRQDARAAHREFRARLSPGQRAFVFGLSLGGAILLESAPDLSPAPDGIVLDAIFSSAREAVVVTGLVRPFWRFLLPDIWNNVDAVRRLRSPLLLMHSDADAVLPVSMARRVYEAAPEPKSIAIQHGLPHDAPVSEPSEDFWRPVIEFLRPARLTPS